MLPEPSFIFGCPQTVSALPDVSQLPHFLRDFSLEIQVFLGRLLFSTPCEIYFYVGGTRPGILRTKGAVVAVACDMFCLNVTLYITLFTGVEVALKAKPQP